MKKIVCFLSFSVLALTSCNSGEDTTPYDPNAIQSTTLLKRAVETFDDNTVVTTEFNYDGFKITSFAANDNTSGSFTYSGNQITEIKYYDGTTLSETDLFTYNLLGQITTHVALQHDSDYAEKEVYTHNADGSVSFTAYSGSLTEQNNVDYTGKLFFNNAGEVTKKETYAGGGTISSETYTYDLYNNPLKNVIGLNTVFIYQNGDIDGVNRNLVETSGTASPRSISYQYSEFSRFPTQSSLVSVDESVTTLYFYE